jgi:hypothetical protein
MSDPTGPLVPDIINAQVMGNPAQDLSARIASYLGEPLYVQAAVSGSTLVITVGDAVKSSSPKRPVPPVTTATLSVRYKTAAAVTTAPAPVAGYAGGKIIASLRLSPDFSTASLVVEEDTSPPPDAQEDAQMQFIVVRDDADNAYPYRIEWIDPGFTMAAYERYADAALIEREHVVDENGERGGSEYGPMGILVQPDPGP